MVLPTRPSVPARAQGRGEPAAASCLPFADPMHADAIVQSHQRCAALGVSRIDAPDFARFGRSDLGHTLERNRRLHDHAAPVMSLLHDQIARTESMVLLTDSSGTVIHSVGDDDFLDRADKVALKPGANWSEGAKGTNAIGTALVEELPTLVHADEHYLHANHFLTCSAAPILDPRGNIVGVLDVSGDSRSYQRHTLALVRMSARMIENRWLTEDFGHTLRLHFHARAQFVGTYIEGILAVREDGRVIGSNRGALEQLGLSGAALRMQTIDTLFGIGLAVLIDHGRQQVPTPILLTAAEGRQFSAFVRSDRLGWTLRPAAASPAVPASAPIDIGGPRHGSAGPGTGDTAPRRPGAAGGALALLRTGDSQIDALVGKIQRVLDRDIPILLLGETGTGKELLARAIHADSARGEQPFVAVNCASVPESLIEAELFGHEDGTFIGGRRPGAPGKIVQASGGTLFLDEIGDMPLALQAQLLRLLQERCVTPRDAGGRSVPVDVAIVCATHRNLREMIEAKAFREDLYHHLNGLSVRLPPLRERGDLPALVRRILDAESGPGRHHLTPGAAGMFQRYGWPGNVRQLFHVLRTACAMAGAQQQITRAHLPDDFVEEATAAVRRHAQRATLAVEFPAPTTPSPTAFPVEGAGGGESAVTSPAGAAARAEAADGEPATAGGIAAPETLPFALSTLHDMELDLIRRTLDSVQGNISLASKRLGISRNTIYRKLRWNTRG